MLQKNSGQIKIAFKHFPLKMHKAALPAATASLYADSMGKFSEFHKRVTPLFKDLDVTKILDVAEGIGLDRAEVEKQLKNPELLKKVQRDISEGKRVGVKGVPMVFINGRPLKQRTLKGFQTMIDEELKKVTN